MNAFRLLVVAASVVGAITFESPLPRGFDNSSWAYLTNQNPSLAVLPGSFNRSVFDSPSDAKVSNSELAAFNARINRTSFVAYEPEFFDILGPQAKIEMVHPLAFQTNEAACISDDNQMLFVEWGPPGGDNGTHDWQYLLNTETTELKKIQTQPPTANIHGCVYYKGFFYVVTDGSANETAYLAKIDPRTWQRTVLLNNFYERPFIGFNDLEIDLAGNFYATDSRSGWGRAILPWTPTTVPTVYFVNGTTLRAKEIYVTGDLIRNNVNGIAISADGRTLYISDTGASQTRPSLLNIYGPRSISALDVKDTGKAVPRLSGERMLSNALTSFYDGIRVSRGGWLFAGSGQGVDVLDPDTGLTLGTIRVGGGSYAAVTLAFENHTLWIVGKGGLWKVRNVAEQLRRPW